MNYMLIDYDHIEPGALAKYADIKKEAIIPEALMGLGGLAALGLPIYGAAKAAPYVGRFFGRLGRAGRGAMRGLGAGWRGERVMRPADVARAARLGEQAGRARELRRLGELRGLRRGELPPWALPAGIAGGGLGGAALFGGGPEVEVTKV